MDNEVKSILLVDDDEDYTALVSRWLRKSFDVSAVNSGEEALEYLKGNKPDLVLLDCAMPGLSGIDVLKKIREDSETKDMTVIFLTGTEDEDAVARAKELEPAGYILKTEGKAALTAGISEVISK